MTQQQDQAKIRQVIIVGGGLVGGLTALLLAKAGIQATVLDASPRLDEAQVLAQTNPRVLAINLASMKLMQHAGIWQHLKRHQPYSGMQVWNRDGMGEILFGQGTAHMPMQHDWLGSMVEPSILNLAIQTELQQEVKNYRNDVKVIRLEKLPHTWQVTLSTGEQLETELLIGADGANSFVRNQAGIELDILNYQETAISCAIRTEKPHLHIARQIFLSTGPLAFLPMHSLNPVQEGYWQSIVWTLPSDYAEEYSQLSDAEFQQKVTQASHYMLGELQQVVSRASFPLIARQAQQYVSEGLALVGDAAHVIHPLAGQGVNLGCLDAGVLVDCLLKDMQREVWANIQTLRKYEHQRRLHNSMMMHSMSGLGWINKAQLKPLQWLRSEGMHLVSGQPKLIEFFSEQASGLSALRQTRYV
ncbi:FAD-dependent monooxygenase [Acinetobacter puyangensis]|uniref:Ubiquinone biosynthesis hydroxylase, UbiH/UbiF/VisC/COQ6 family n=1 Tax=Acinetobacter puyangensis TaxID=1096779 RepID=A0A240EAB0_9GAMM|nr:FAD-dependent monooxygenase [Acinetobacter puyangensis]SNX45486.1 Ubiquinone biosynthesis hydroxylase, UbiH/UbiF/VisC/COQ6 family [Acinetobacter puyangensis]